MALRNDGDIPRHMRTVRIAWTVNDLGLMVACNHAFCVVMGYGREEVIDHPGTRLLRPRSAAGDPEIAAIWAAKQRLKHGQSTEEHIASWIEAKDGHCIELDAVMTFNPLCQLWDVVADVGVEHLDGPQLRTPWDHLRWRNYRLENLVLKVEDTMLRVETLADRVARLRTEDEVIEDRLRIPQKQRKARTDKGTRLVTEKDFDERLHAALGDGYIAVKDVLKATRVGSRMTLTKYLQPFRKGKPETPAQTLKRLGMEWFPELYLL